MTEVSLNLLNREFLGYFLGGFRTLEYLCSTFLGTTKDFLYTQFVTPLLIDVFILINKNKKMSKKTFIFSIAAAMAAIAFTSCSQDADDFSSSNKSDLPSQQLDVNFAIEGMKTTTRAAITPVNAWTNGANIGVTVYKNNTAGDLMKTGTQNLKWTYDGSDWNGENPTYFFPGEEGYVTAYYPWADGINPTAISIDNTKDWMYAKLTDNKHVAYGSPQTSLTMNHATAQIKVNIIRKGYVGVGNVTSLTVTSPKMASAATLNSTTGALSGHTLISKFTENLNKTLGSGNPSAATACLHESFVPVNDAAADVVFNATIDGLKLKCVINQKFEQGKIYTFNLNATDDLQNILQIDEVIITPWGNESASGDLELETPKLYCPENPIAITKEDFYRTIDNCVFEAIENFHYREEIGGYTLNNGKLKIEISTEDYVGSPINGGEYIAVWDSFYDGWTYGGSKYRDLDVALGDLRLIMMPGYNNIQIDNNVDGAFSQGTIYIKLVSYIDPDGKEYFFTQNP